MKYLVLLLYLSGCVFSSSQAELRRCLIEDNAFGPDYVEALGVIERELETVGALPSVSKEGYRVLIERIAKGDPMPDLYDLCTGVEDCWNLAMPSVNYRYAHCPIDIEVDTPLREASVWAETRGDFGPEYQARLLDAMDDEEFSDLLYRGALIQSIIPTLE